MLFLSLDLLQHRSDTARREQAVGICQPDPFTTASLECPIDHRTFVGAQICADRYFVYANVRKAARHDCQMFVCTIRTFRIHYQHFKSTKRQILMTPIAQGQLEPLEKPK